MFKLIYGWLVSLGERGVIGDGEEKENAEAGNVGSSQTDADVGSADDSEGDQKAEELLQQEDSSGVDETPDETPDEQKDINYWRTQAEKLEKDAKHWKGDYYKEKTKRQEYDKKYGRFGLAGSLANGSTNGERVSEAKAPPKKLEEIETASEFAEHILTEAKKQVREELTSSQTQTKMVNSEKAARVEFDGKDGMPSYDEMFENEVAPFLRANPGVVQVIGKLEDPARAAYTLGLLMNPKYLSLLTKRQQSKAREDLTNQIDEATKKAVTIKNGKAGSVKSGKKTAADYEAMSTDEFEKEIAAAKDQ